MSIKPLVYVELVRGVAGRACLDIDEAMAPASDACGQPLPFKFSQTQIDTVTDALATIRRTLVELYLVDNVQAVRGRAALSSGRGKSASAAARTLY